MAKNPSYYRRDNYEGGVKRFGAPAPELSLDSILAEVRRDDPHAPSAQEEYRDEPAPEEEPFEPEYPDEGEEPFEPEYPDEEGEPFEPEYPDEEEEPFEPEYPDEGEESLKPEGESPADGEDAPTDDAASDGEPEDGDEASPEPDSEGYEDDEDFYAGASSAEDTAEKTEGGFRVRHHNVTPKTGGPWARFLALLAAATVRRQQNLTAPEPEPENQESEMAPGDASRYYMQQLPSLRMRSFGALGVSALLAWITLACSRGWALPGHLQTSVHMATLVCMIGLITVMLMGLDIITAGVMSLLRGRPGAETILMIASLASLADGVYVAVTRNVELGLPPCVIPALSIAFALVGAWNTCSGYACGFYALDHAANPYSVTSEVIPEKSSRYMIKSQRSPAGFVRRSEEPCLAENICSEGFIPMMLAAIAVSLAASLGFESFSSVFHIFAMMTGCLASFGWLLSYPILFSRTAQHLMKNGSALAGWAGARDIGSSRRLILTDTDIFPDGTVEITGVRILDKKETEKIISFTGSMLTASGSGAAVVFSELMRRSRASLEKVEDFTVGEGGVKGYIRSQEVRTGTVGYMHLSGVKVPDKLKAENALYVAVSGKLAGIFLFRYRSDESVRSALHDLRREHRKPIFAMRDFNVDPIVLQQSFDVSTEGFDFPNMRERYRISGIPASGESSIAGIMARDGLDVLVDVSEAGTQLFTGGRFLAWLSLITAAFGVFVLFVASWIGQWQLASAGNLLLYMLLSLVPTVLLALATRK